MAYGIVGIGGAGAGSGGITTGYEPQNSASRAEAALEADAEGRGYVTIPSATTEHPGAVRMGYATQEESRRFAVQMSNDGTLFAQVPEKEATATVAGVVKLGTNESSSDSSGWRCPIKKNDSGQIYAFLPESVMPKASSGTWKPKLTGKTPDGTVETFSTEVDSECKGYYSKTGTLVFFSLSVKVKVGGAAVADGTAYCSLPFPMSSAKPLPKGMAVWEHYGASESVLMIDAPKCSAMANQLPLPGQPVTGTEIKASGWYTTAG